MSASRRYQSAYPPSQDSTATQARRNASSRIPTTRPSAAPTAPPASSSSKSKGTSRISEPAKRVGRVTEAASRPSGIVENGKIAYTASSFASQSIPALSKRVARPQSPARLPTKLPSRSEPRTGVLLPPPVLRTPSLASGSTVSTYDSPRSAALRRKPSTIERYAAAKRAGIPVGDKEDKPSERISDEFNDAFEDSVLGISMPVKSSYRRLDNYEPKGQAIEYPAETNARPQFPARDLTPPITTYAPSATPSTRYTDSPFSHVPTPSSASSYASAVPATTAGTTAAYVRPHSPTRSRQIATTATRSAPHIDTSSASHLPITSDLSFSSTSTAKVQPRPAAAPQQESLSKPKAAQATGSVKKSTPPPSRGKLVKNPPASKASNKASGPKQEVPPELAHLNVDPPTESNVQKALPPSRPSRDGTPNLEDLASPSHVVQSELPHLYTTYHKRTPSNEVKPAVVPSPSPSLKSRFGFGSKSPSKHSSPRVDSAVSSPPPLQTSRGSSLDSRPSEMPRLARKDSPAVGPSPSPVAKSPRFGFFHRKPKEDGKTVERPKRLPSRGPAAGTGHEGYGKFNNTRGRGSTTTTTSASIGSFGFRSPSADSCSSYQSVGTDGTRKGSIASGRSMDYSSSDMDDFLTERLKPVILRGQGAQGAPANGNAGSSLPQPNSKVVPKVPSQIVRAEPAAPSTSTSKIGVPSAAKRPAHPRRVPSDSSADEPSVARPSLAGRRSSSRLSEDDVKPHVRGPPSIRTRFAPPRPSRDSYDAEASAGALTDTSLPVSEDYGGNSEGRWLRPATAPARYEPEDHFAHHGNFSQRVYASTPPRHHVAAPGGIDIIEADSSDAVDRIAQQCITDYAMLDPVEPVALEEVAKIVYENTSPEDSMSESYAPSRFARFRHRQPKSVQSPPELDRVEREPSRSRRLDPPPALLRLDSTESAEVLDAQAATASRPPQVVTIKKSVVFADHNQVYDVSGGSHEDPGPIPRPDPVATSIATPAGPQVSPPRIPRLSPVGRIPKVVSKRDRERKPSSISFSRPFGTSQPKPSVKPPGSLYTEIRELASPTETNAPPPTFVKPEYSLPCPVNAIPPNHIFSPAYGPATDADRMSEFLSLPHQSFDTAYTGSSGTNSTTVPCPITPFQFEDNWHEYDDFLDEVTLPQATPLSTSSSFGAPFQYASMLLDKTSPNMPAPLRWSKQARPAQMAHHLPQSQPSPDVLSVPQQIARFMQPSMSPLSTPHALSELVGYYGDRSNSMLLSNDRSSIPISYRGSVAYPSQSGLRGDRGSLASSRNSRTSAHSRSASVPYTGLRQSYSSLGSDTHFRRNAHLLDIAEVDGDSKTSMSNLRFGALMTTKWLSFGRVLFSPAHNEMRLADEPRVLIIDGMGSDWSYYVALSYPSAAVYNLGPEIVDESSTTWPGVNQKRPKNHTHIHHRSIDAAFPFPKGFFTAVVFRFPSATTDDAFHASIYECKRVLRPGGYLEVAVLDLDLMNMGTRARQAVRGLKTRLQQNDEKVSLRNLSDSLIRLIGRRGFEEIQRCIVGVPAAGRIPRSTDASSGDNSSNSRNSESAAAMNRPGWVREDRHSRGAVIEQDFSFADLLEDARSNGTSQQRPHGGTDCPQTTTPHDEAIIKMVAKVGRWWYSTCYEKKLLAANDRSIWNDRPLLRECEKQGTAFRLLICYAQKPAQPKRRTVSL